MLNVCLIGNAGGHMEQLKQLRGMDGKNYKLSIVPGNFPTTE